MSQSDVTQITQPARATSFLVRGLAIAALVIAVAAPASATDIPIISPRTQVVPNNPAFDFQAYQGRQQRQGFQQQQQQFRQSDRDAVIQNDNATQQNLAIPVPRFRQNCRAQSAGNSYLTNCN